MVILRGETQVEVRCMATPRTTGYARHPVGRFVGAEVVAKSGLQQETVPAGLRVARVRRDLACRKRHQDVLVFFVQRKRSCLPRGGTHGHHLCHGSARTTRKRPYSSSGAGRRFR